MSYPTAILIVSKEMRNKMLKGIAINPFINANSTLAEIEQELEDALARAEQLDWEITDQEERELLALTRLAKAKGSKRNW
jgi:hypothetical protein